MMLNGWFVYTIHLKMLVRWFSADQPVYSDFIVPVVAALQTDDLDLESNTFFFFKQVFGLILVFVNFLNVFQSF